MITIAVVLLVLVITPFTAAQFGFQVCNKSGNYPAGGTYQANLALLSARLPSNASSSELLFAKGSVGAAPDTVYGLALCRGDTNASFCQACVAAAFQEAQQSCALNKDAAYFAVSCIVGFSSNRDLLDGPDSSWESDSPSIAWNTQNIMSPVFPGWDPGDPGSVSVITSIVKVLLRDTAKLAAAYNNTRRYATLLMNTGGSFPPLYSMAQCTPDLAPGDCGACLQNSTDLVTDQFAGRLGLRVLRLRCNIRYEGYSFFDGEPMRTIGSPSSPPGAMPPTPASTASQKHKRSLRKVYVIAVVVPLLFVLCIFVIVLFRFIRRRKQGKGSHNKAKMKVEEHEEQVWGLDGTTSEFTVYDLWQVSEATCNFSEENKLGKGGFGPVYKGRFSDGSEIAVKRLASYSGQGFTEFKNEIQLIAKLQHTNLVRLLGCCSQGDEKILIYEYLPNKSLDFFIFDPTRKYIISWSKRFAIIEGIAQGMLYLHKHSRLRVIHRDLKASNILLDRNMNPKISDFGLAKIFSTNDTEGNTKRIVGTYGYMAPEYASEGIFSIKSDVFSFGVLILEIISGKKISSFYRYGEFINLLGHAWQLWKDGLWLQLVDASLVDEHHTVEIMRCINIGLLCVQESAADRPTMSHVVAMLSSESMTLPEPKHPAYFYVRVTNEEASTVVEPSSPNDVTVSALDGR